MRTLLAAVLLLPVFTAGCAAAGGDDRAELISDVAVAAEPTEAHTAPVVEERPAAPADPLALPAEGEPSAPDDAAGLTALLTAAEQAIADPATAPERLAAAGHWQQVALRKLGQRPELVEPVVTALPEQFQAGVRGNLFAGSRLAEMHAPAKPADPAEAATPKPRKLPAWHIVAPPAPEELKAHYEAAQAATGVHWTYLAAVNLVETRMGRIRGDSVVGAQGPMQFMPATWAEWGEGDVHNPADAIMAAARYLKWGGMPEDVNGALFRYNRDVRYVDAVRTYAERMQADPRAFHAYYHWQVYFGSVWLPEGWDGTTA